jgi:acyl-CoA-binding protein
MGLTRVENTMEENTIFDIFGFFQDDAWGVIKGVYEENWFQEAIKCPHDNIHRRLEACQQRLGKANLY